MNLKFCYAADDINDALTLYPNAHSKFWKTSEWPSVISNWLNDSVTVYYHDCSYGLIKVMHGRQKIIPRYDG